MNPKSQYVEDQMQQCREHWFKDHVATTIVPVGVEETSSIQIIQWQNPKSWNYGCRFIIHRRWLCVVGDIGEAVFEWSEDLTLGFLGGLNFDYFMSKCQASPEGRSYESFDTDVAEQYRKMRIKELEEESDKGDDSAKELELLKENSRLCKDEWRAIAQDYYDDTGDAEGASSISGMGVVPSVHAIGMFVGLQMAINQLKAA